MKKRQEDLDILMRLARGKLPASERRRIEATLKRDRNLRELYSLIKQLDAESQALKWPQIGGAVTDLAGRMYDDIQKARASRRKRHGITLFDSKLLPLPEGVRPAAVDTRRIKYQFDDVSLDISLYPISPDSYEIVGQISGAKEGTQFDVSLKNRQTQLVARTDRFHLFRFERVPAMRYELSLRVGKRLVGTIDIEL